jgi:hypothetical protein
MEILEGFTLSRTIIKYKTFKSSSDFEDWQQITHPSIVSILPVASQPGVKNNDKEFSVNISVFVTYMEEE